MSAGARSSAAKRRGYAFEGSSEVEAQRWFSPATETLRAELVSDAVDPRAAHPESASDIAQADESVGGQPQLGGDPISDGLDVLVVEHHCLAPPDDAGELRPI